MATAEFSKFVGVLSAALSQHHLSGLEYYSAIKRNAFESILMRWMNLEPIIQSEVSQKEKDKYHIIMHIYGIWKNDTEEFIYRAAMEK